MLTFEQQQELESERFAREDYLSEAFGAEARLLAAQADDEIAESNGFTGWHAYQAGLREFSEKRRAANSISRAHAVPDNIPF